MGVDVRTAGTVSPKFGPVADEAFAGFRVNVRAARMESPPLAPAEAVPPLTGAGVHLAKCVLMILAAVLALLILAAFWQEQQFSTMLATSIQSNVGGARPGPDTQQAGPDQLKARQETLKAFQEVADASREFWLKLGQMILLNLLLPLLTALLGYIFGSRHARND
jgi:hypothetical protein